MEIATVRTEYRTRLRALELWLRERLVSRVDPEERDFVEGDFWLHHHNGQLPPIDGWRTWLIQAGRGFGKTRAGAEWVWSLVRGEGKVEIEQNPLVSSVVETPIGSVRSRGISTTLDANGNGTKRPNPNLHIALVGATIDEARRVMVEGPSGILSLARPEEIESWSPSRRELRFKNGALATLYSGAHAEGLRGPEHHFAWCDEMAKWPQAEDAWMNLQLGLRCGERPRVLITTTPKPSALLRAIIDAPDTVRTGGPTMANPFLPRDFIAAMEARFAGTRIGRQELDGEMLDDVEGSLWPRALIEACRIPPRTGEVAAGTADGGGFSHSTALDGESPPPRFARSPVAGRSVPRTELGLLGAIQPATPCRGGIIRTIIGVDPPATANGTCGIVVCGRDGSRRGWVLADCSVSGVSPERWAAAVARAAEQWQADAVVAERNQGGDMVKSVLDAASADMRVTLVHAAKGKVARAEPVATLFERGDAGFAGRFPELEAQLSGMQNGGGYAGPGHSPDRADAMVWAMTALMLEPEATEPRIRWL